jgi:hypothetical protein
MMIAHGRSIISTPEVGLVQGSSSDLLHSGAALDMLWTEGSGLLALTERVCV